MGNSERASKRRTKWTRENQKVLHELKTFVQQRTYWSESVAADRQNEPSMEIHTNKWESLQRTKGQPQKFFDRKVQQLDQLTVGRNQQGKLSKLLWGGWWNVQNWYVPRHCSLKVRVWEPLWKQRKSWITEGNHVHWQELEKIRSRQYIICFVQRRSGKRSLQSGNETHSRNDPLSRRELNYAIKELPTANNVFDINNVQPKMMKKSGPGSRGLKVQPINKSLE